MSEYVSRLGNESSTSRAVRAAAFLLGAIALLDLAADQLTKALGGVFVEHVTSPADREEESRAD